MKQELTAEQKAINTMIEQLRERKEYIKSCITAWSNDLITIDIQIRELRQKIPTLTPVVEKTVRPKKTTEQKLRDNIERMKQQLRDLGVNPE